MARRVTRRRGTFAGDDGSFVEGAGGMLERAATIAAPADVLHLGTEAAADLARIASAALGAALEAIPWPAFVIRVPATILHANARGRSLLAAQHDHVMGLVRGTTPPPRGPARFPIDSAPDHMVVVIHDLESDARSRLAAVTRRWGLTPRQSAVLALVAQGESNRAVAGRLGCSEKTVELHVSALLAKTRCSSRSQLVASFWTDLG